MKVQFNVGQASRLFHSSNPPLERKPVSKKMETGATPVLLWLAAFGLLSSALCLPAFAQTPAASGTVITIAGNGLVGFSGDGGPATNAAINEIGGLAFGPDGTLYIADSGNFRIRAIDPATGIIRTIAGTGVDGDGGNNGPATNATISNVIGLATDPVRNILYLTDIFNNYVRKVNLTDGLLTVYAGVSEPGFAGDGGPATLAQFTFPVSAGIDGQGRLSVIDLHNFRIRRVDPVSGIITTIAGSGVSTGPLGDGGPATGAAFGSPLRLTADSAGNVYLRDGDPNGTYFTVRRINAASGIITTIVGGGTNQPGTGVATNMFFNNLAELAANDAGELFVSSPLRVFKLNIATGIIAPFAGAGTSGLGNEGDPALNAKFASITALAVAPGGGLVIADSDNARIRYVAPDSIKLTNDSGQTSFTLPWVSSLTGDFILENNPNLTNINAGALTNVGRVILVQSNVNVGVLDLSGVQSAGTVSISGNTAAGVLDLGSLTTVSGDLVVEGNTSAGTLDLGSLESADTVSVSGNTAAGVLDLSSLTTVSGDLTLDGNTAAGELDLESLTTVSGDLSIEENSSAGNLDLGSLTEVSGDLTIESNAPAGNLDLGSLTNYGCGTNEVTMTLNGGTVQMTNGLTLCTNATLTGSTTIDGSITNNGTIEPGASPGRLNLTSNLHLGSSSRLRLEIGGYETNQFDSMNVGNSVTLGGTLTVTLLNNFTNVMTNGASFTLLTAGSPLGGSFANVTSGGTITTSDGRARFTVLYAGQTTVRLTDLVILNPDSDGDGVLDTAELLAGTDPHNPASFFRIVAIQPEPGGLRLTWSTVGGRSYVVQTNGSLTNAFADFSPLIPVPGTGESTTNHLDASGSTGAARYYRVRLGP